MKRRIMLALIPLFVYGNVQVVSAQYSSHPHYPKDHDHTSSTGNCWGYAISKLQHSADLLA